MPVGTSFHRAVNSDGTLSRIANWERLSEEERNAAQRRIVKRNAARLESLRQGGLVVGDRITLPGRTDDGAVIDVGIAALAAAAPPAASAAAGSGSCAAPT